MKLGLYRKTVKVSQRTEEEELKAYLEETVDESEDLDLLIYWQVSDRHETPLL